MEPTYYQYIRPIPFRNDSGETIPPFSMMRITGVIETGSNKIYTVDKPNATFQRFHLVSGHLAVGDGKHGTGNDGRFVDSKINWTGAGGYGPSPDSWELEKNRIGFTVLESPSTAGIYKVFQEPTQVVMAKASEAISASSTGTATIQIDGTTAGPWDDITVANTFVDSGTGVSSGDKFFAKWNSPAQIWQIIKGGGTGGGGDSCANLKTWADGLELDTDKMWALILEPNGGGGFDCLAVEVIEGC